MRSAEEKNASIAVNDLSGHVRERDVEAVVADLERLREISLESDRQAAARGLFERSKAAVVRFLFESLPPPEACRALQDVIEPSEVLQILEHGESSVDAAALLAASPYIGFPDVWREPKLAAILIQAPDADITSALKRYIHERAPEEAAAGTDYDRHLRSLSAFKTIVWAPDDKGLSRAVALLARRPDADARALTAECLRALPWGGNRMATAALVAGLLDNADKDTEGLIRDALDAHPEPGLARRLMLEALREYAPARVVLLALRDLRECRTDRERVATIEWLYGLRGAPASDSGADLRKDIQAEIAAMNTDGWPWLTRAYLDVLLSTWFPSIPRVTGATMWGRAAIRLIHVFERLRLDHMGCMVTVPVIIGIGYASMVVMNIFLGKPPEGYALVDDGALALWVLTAGLTAHTHFSGHESLRDRFLMGCALLGAIAVFFAIALLVRLLPTGAP